FVILRKPPHKILALQRIVYDNDKPAADLKGVSRWSDEKSAWTADQANGFGHAAGDGGMLSWLRYHHALRTSGNASQVGPPELLTDFMGYNTWEPAGGGHPIPGGNWVGDLILECEVTVDQPAGALVLELS